MQALLYNSQGIESGSIELQDTIFGREVKPALIHRLLLLQLAGLRNPIAHTKTRGERNGSTRKLYKQKGTGNARAGSARAPNRKGGGVAFGPRNNANFTMNMNKKERRSALLSLLSSKAVSTQIKVIEKFDATVEKTKNMAGVVKNMNISTGVIAILPEDAHAFRGARNLPNVRAIGINYLNPRDLLKYNELVFTKDSLAKLTSLHS